MAAVILCGMPDEHRILTATLPRTLILSGTDKLDLPKLIPANCTRLICMGVCGGLSSDLKVPDVALATTVIDKGGAIFSCDFDWNVKATAAAGLKGTQLHAVQYYSSGLFDEADDPVSRDVLFRKYGAHAIDDETRYMVAAATAHSPLLPFNVVRPLSDASDDNLPLMARGKIMNPDGSPNIPYLLSALGQDQGDGAESVFTVAEHYRQSLDMLEDVARALRDLIEGDMES